MADRDAARRLQAQNSREAPYSATSRFYEYLHSINCISVSTGRSVIYCIHGIFSQMRQGMRLGCKAQASAQYLFVEQSRLAEEHEICSTIRNERSEAQTRHTAQTRGRGLQRLAFKNNKNGEAVLGSFFGVAFMGWGISVSHRRLGFGWVAFFVDTPTTANVHCYLEYILLVVLYAWGLVCSCAASLGNNSGPILISPVLASPRSWYRALTAPTLGHASLRRSATSRENRNALLGRTRQANSDYDPR